MTSKTNTEAAAAYEDHRAAIIARSEALIAKLNQPVERVNWSHASSLEKVRADLLEISRFIGA